MSKEVTTFQKATLAEMSERISTLVELMLKGHTRGQIVHYCTQNYKVKERQALIMMAKATARIKEINHKDAETVFSTILMNYWKIFRKATDKNDLHLCMQVLEKISKLKGLDQITVNHVFMNDINGIEGIDENVIEAEFEHESDD